MQRSILFVISAAVLLAGSPVSGQGASPRVAREMNAVQQELLRRDPGARPYAGYDPAQVDPGAARMARNMSDAQLAQAFATYARMTGAQAPAAAAVRTPAPVPAPERSAPAQDSRLAKAQAVEILWQGNWYPGRVLETDGARTKVRYDGWSSSWDEWVGADRLRGPGEAKAAAATPAPRQPVGREPAQSKPAGKHEAHCKPFWAQARTDCFLRDRESFSCPVIATNKYEQCLKTGRWY